jgi:tetratricopeptide (TPR) repeat protein
MVQSGVSVSPANTLEHTRRSLELFRDTQDRPRQGYALNDVGVVYQGLTRYAEAVDCHDEALNIARETGDRSLEAAALNGLGNARRQLELADVALGLHGRALEVAEQINDRYEQAQAYEGLGRSYRAQGMSEESDAHLRRALGIYTEIGAPDADRVRELLT